MSKKALALLLSFSLLGAACGGAGGYVLSRSSAKSIETAAEETDRIPADSSVRNDAGISLVSSVETAEFEFGNPEISTFSYSNIADIVEEVMPSIVAITNKSVQEVRSFYGRQPYAYESESAGSGFIVGSNETELLICTNNHVVDAADELSVTFCNDVTVPAYTKGTDPDNDLAIAAVALSDISDETMAEIKIAKIGDSETMRVGEQVVAIGNALGYGQSVTTGIISAKGRSIQASDGYGANVTTYEDLIQTDAAINFGNSGGALLNMNGEVIGINSAKVSDGEAESMGYAIPIGKAMPILEELMTLETRLKVSESDMGYVGISGQDVSYEATRLYSIPKGIYVSSVGEGTPAQQAGLEEGSIITAFDGTAVESMRDLQSLLMYYAAGETVPLTVYVNQDGIYTKVTLNITLGSRNGLQ